MSTLTVDNIVGATTAANVKLPAGACVQFKTAAAVGQQTITSSSYVSLTGLSIAFAPKFSTSYLYILYNSHIYLPQTGGNWRGGEIKVYKNGSAISGAGAYGLSANNNHADDRSMDYVTKDTVHVPGSTASATYDIRGALVAGSISAVWNHTTYGGGGRLTIMEIAQ